MQVLDLTTTTHLAEVEAVTTAEEILDFQQVVRMVPIADSVARYAVDLVRATRPTDARRPISSKKYINFGASVRAAQFLVLAAKARALMHKRYHVTYEDVTPDASDSAASHPAQFPGRMTASQGRHSDQAARGEPAPQVGARFADAAAFLRSEGAGRNLQPRLGRQDRG